ncbi:TATA box-binding protein-associated factor RNA polymerase I subunit B [Malaya genurostris]|uniref:TATA box-binding protein-associated factor RNA polymerase I subunit B n=1 Tax=Malaya genurostris TaxID=325434 RepID=UPI0026F3B8B6|nr:TATA box-binding protein-associated factor RNA polymerase I subunit B [Malaya genurostris]
MDKVCDVCGQTEFTVEAGFYYCVECGTKSKHHGQELVDEDLANMRSQGAALLKLKKYKKCKRITSWEQANYILLGLTEKLISLGAEERLKLAVLQLWTAYLRRMEIAFFDKNKPEKPRMHVFYKKVDAEILYKRRKKPAKRKRGDGSKKAQPTSSKAASELSCSTVTNKSVTSRTSMVRKARTNQRQMMDAEYDSIVATQKSDLTSSLYDLSMRSLNSSRTGGDSDASEGVGQKIRFSRLARIRMKRKLKMSSEHIRKHEQDVEEKMKCHRSKHCDPKLPKKTFAETAVKRPTCWLNHQSETRTFSGEYLLNSYRSATYLCSCLGLVVQPAGGPFHGGFAENLTRMLLSTFLALGLNVIESDVQLADLIRFYREHHLPHKNVMQYLPEELDPSCYKETLSVFHKGVTAMMHSELRESVMDLAKFLNVKPKTPDLLKLCRRYLEELCLPMDLLVYIKRIMSAFPPEMQEFRPNQLPNYEGRAMAFILFVLKLLFGINGTSEMKMSKSAAKLNRTISNLGLFDTSVFVFTEWIRYVEMRRVILGQINNAINRQVANEEGVDQDADIFIDHTMRKRRMVDSCRDPHVRQKVLLSKIKDVITNIVDTHHRHGSSRDCRSDIEFEPSLTPYKSYLEQFLLAYNKDGKVHIPNFMSVDHTNRIVSPFVNLTDLKYLLFSNHQIRLIAKKVPSALKLFKFTDTTPIHVFVSVQLLNEDPVMYAEDCDDDEWDPPEKPHAQEGKTHEKLLNQIIIRNEIERQRTEQIVQDQSEQQSSSAAADTVEENESFSNHSEEMFSQLSDEIAPNQAAEKSNRKLPMMSSVHLLTPSYDYWVRFFGRGEVISFETFDEQIVDGLPDNFRLVLEECARVVENRPQFLYQELMTLETYFFYAIQPVERFFRPDQWPAQVLYEKVKKDRRVTFATKYY